MNYGCFDIKGYIACVNQGWTFRDSLPQGNLASDRAQERIFMNQRSHPFQPCFNLCLGEVRSRTAMRRLLRIFIILFSFWTISSSAGKFLLTLLKTVNSGCGKLNMTENVTSKQAVSRISNGKYDHLFANLRTMIKHHFSHWSFYSL